MRVMQWLITFEDQSALAELATSLRRGTIDDRGFQYAQKKLVDAINGLKVEIFSNEHPPPHFRVSYQGETANYLIKDCAQTNGGLEKFYRNIRRWHEKNKNLLIQAWDKSRPTNCPVGKYVES